MAIDRPQLAMETLGLNLGESKAMLEGVQDIVVAQQVAEDLERRCRCPNCGERYRGKGGGTKEVKTLFGMVDVANPRWKRCPCQQSGAKTFRPTVSWLQGQTTPELLYLETKWASLIPFGKVADLLLEVLPVDAGTNHETIRRHLHETAERMENELGDERQLKLFAEEVRAGRPGAARWPNHSRHRRWLCEGGAQGRLLRSDRRPKCRRVSAGGQR